MSTESNRGKTDSAMGDPFTMEARLCDDDGIVRRGAMHHGTDYPCTGHAHYAGEHIKCISQAHPDGLPTDMLRLIRDPGIDLGEGLTPPPRSATAVKARRRLQEIEGHWE